MAKEKIMKIVDTLIIIMLISSTVFVGYLGYLMFLDGGKIIKLTGDAITDKTVYYPGDKIEFSINYCKYTSIPSKVTVSFVDGITYTIPKFSRNAKEGCDIEPIIVEIPQQIVPGEYYAIINFNYNVNPFRSVNYAITSNYITIKEIGEEECQT